MPEQLSLPYLEIKETVGRSYLRDNFTVSSKVAYKIPFDKLQIREGFNKRIVYEGIEELAASIKAKGLQEPLTVDVIPSGEIYLEKGHRRYKALQMLRDAGEVIDVIDCYPNPKTVTEMERMEDVYNSNMYSQKLKPIEQANCVYDLKHNFGKVSNDEIAKRLGISRQKVDYLLLISESDDRIKNEILKGDMNLTDAISFIRSKKKNDKATDKQEINANKTPATIPEPKDPLANDLKELAELGENGKQSDENENEEIQEPGEEVRTSNYDPESYESKGLDLVGNKIVDQKEKVENDGTVKFDESRDEIKSINNVIKLADKLENIVNKLDVPDGSKKDVCDIVKWMQKDLAECRDWIHKNKKQNKKAM